LEGKIISRWTIEDVLNRALSMEKQSYDLYIWAINRVTSPGIKKFLKELAQEELNHKEKISNVLKDRKKIAEIGREEVEDLKIVDWLKDTKLSKDTTYQEILIYAGKREKETYEYYGNISEKFKDNNIGKLFSKLAQEELKHKNKIEREYDRYILKEM